MTRESQLRWLALLAVAVLLPTVSLLWFMSRVVANERLVIRQKLGALYQDKLQDASRRASELLSARLNRLSQTDTHSNPYTLLRDEIISGSAQGIVLWDSNGQLLYPRAESIATINSTDPRLADAWQMELGQQQFAAAAAIYASLENHPQPHIAFAAKLGRSRCLAKLGKIQEAVGLCAQAAFPPRVPESLAQITVEHSRLFLISLLDRDESIPDREGLRQRTLDALREDVFNPAGPKPRLPVTENLFVARKTAELMRRQGNTNNAAELQRWIEAEERSMAAADELKSHSAGNRWTPIRTDAEIIHALHSKTTNGSVHLLFAADGLKEFFEPFTAAFENQESAFRIFDSNGRKLFGNAPEGGDPFVVMALPEAFPGWRIALHFSGDDVLERAAQRQITVYLWTGALVIIVILIVAAFATQAIGRQIRLNQMKNNFIATVSHELKTPLASMRVLVDTLLEGNIRDEAQAKEYLRMTAKENERLSRMIDQFLTFSRMERNKAVFDLSATSAASIVRDALESLQTKFPGQRCPVRVDVSPELSQVSADHDAMVTVLVNLLENACKYTGDVKRIELKVFADRDEVCFAVSDNGIGLSRRHLRRIFDRFYQVDNSLSRQAEGCGLGLSIVKFIVDAHKGRVTVDSRPGEGSTFTVRLPALAQE